MRAGSNWRHLNGLSLGMMGDPVRCLPKVVHPDVAALKLQHNRLGYCGWKAAQTAKYLRWAQGGGTPRGAAPVGSPSGSVRPRVGHPGVGERSLLAPGVNVDQDDVLIPRDGNQVVVAALQILALIGILQHSSVDQTVISLHRALSIFCVLNLPVLIRVRCY